MTFDELLDRVIEVTGLGMRPAAKVANELYEDEAQAYTSEGIRYAAAKLGLADESAPPRTLEQRLAGALGRINCEADPAQVLKHVYRECPRMLPLQAGHLGVYPPRIGRAPKESVFYDDEIREWISELPENVRVLLGAIDLYQGTLTITLYDEANDVDRHVGPIDLTQFEDAHHAFTDAIMELLKRLPRVIASDWN